MPSIRISQALKDQTFFVTCTVKNWYHLFDRHNRFHILEDSFVYCQEHKNLKIYAFVFMTNHFHFIGSADDLSAVLRDMKTFLSKAFKKSILSYEPHVLSIFEDDGKYQFWEKTNYPKLIETEGFFRQKIEYINHNPVRKEYVHFPEDWRWSSVSKIPTRINLSVLDAGETTGSSCYGTYEEQSARLLQRKEYVHFPEDWRWSSVSKIPTRINLSVLDAGETTGSSCYGTYEEQSARLLQRKISPMT